MTTLKAIFSASLISQIFFSAPTLAGDKGVGTGKSKISKAASATYSFDSQAYYKRVKKSLAATSISDISKLSSHEIDLPTFAMLAAFEARGEKVNAEALAATRATIDKMAEQLAQKIKGVQGPEEIIKKLAEYLYVEQGFKAELSKTSDFLDVILKDKTSECQGLSILYLSLAQRLNRPLFGVAFPTHFLVRWDGKGEHLNIETTVKGILAKDDAYYATNLSVKTPLDSPIYMKNLDSKQVMSYLLANLGADEEESDHIDKAINLYKLSAELNPKHSVGYIGLGMLQAKSGNVGEAEKNLLKALALEPTARKAHAGLFLMYRDTKPELALSHGLEAQRLGFHNFDEEISQLKDHLKK